MFKLEFSTSNAAFHSGNEDDDMVDTWEVAEVVNHVSRQLHHGFTSGPVYDVNGNAVGSWELTDN